MRRVSAHPSRHHASPSQRNLIPCWTLPSTYHARLSVMTNVASLILKYLLRASTVKQRFGKEEDFW
ncbi:hypothetical protein C0J52_02894 [Blattella germanica]|nr:hypothetical protein C0J52_02894 [Blattella germanica]